MARATITIKLPAAEKRRAQQAAGTMKVSAWARRLILRELPAENGAGWADHFANLQKTGVRIDGHPEDEIIRRRR